MKIRLLNWAFWRDKKEKYTVDWGCDKHDFVFLSTFLGGLKIYDIFYCKHCLLHIRKEREKLF